MTDICGYSPCAVQFVHARFSIAPGRRRTAPIAFKSSGGRAIVMAFGALAGALNADLDVPTGSCANEAGKMRASHNDSCTQENDT